MKVASQGAALGAVVALGLAALAQSGSVRAAEMMLEGDHISTSQGDVVLHPINHGTLAVEHEGDIIYVDPVGGAERFADLPDPDYILITHPHGDHLDPETLNAVLTDDTQIVAPQAVAEKLSGEARGQTEILGGRQSMYARPGLSIQAVPAYNTTKKRMKYHPEGVGNGYILKFWDTNIYVAGDTEGTPEMRSLDDITAAFVPMNLPYTMPPKQAADAVLDFQPEIVYPYHYKGSDVQKFEKMVEAESDIDVRLREWYD